MYYLQQNDKSYISERQVFIMLEIKNISEERTDCIEINSRKVAVIGCGYVGSATAFALMESGLFSEMVLIDVSRDKAEGEALDISHGLPFAKPMQIYVGEYEDIADASVIIVAAGAGQKPGESRLELARKNVGIFGTVIPHIAEHNREGIILVVANPVDVLTYAAYKLSGFPKNRVFGSGTVLDTARLKYLLGEHLEIDSRSVHAYIIGEHGDSELAAWSSANVSGVPLDNICEMRGYYRHVSEMRRIEEEVKNSAYKIIEKKGATYYGIAMSVRRICEAIVRDEKSVLPVSGIHTGNDRECDVAYSMPVIIGKNGVEGEVPIELDDEEREALDKSVATLRGVISDVMADMN